MILLTLLEGRARHGYELVKSIEAQSQSRLQFHVASLYPMLYRLERQGLVEGCWVEKAGERRRRNPTTCPADVPPNWLVRRRRSRPGRITRHRETDTDALRPS